MLDICLSLCIHVSGANSFAVVNWMDGFCLCFSIELAIMCNFIYLLFLSVLLFAVTICLSFCLLEIPVLENLVCF